MGHNGFYEIIESICEKDRRYKPDSYEFVMESVRFSQNRLQKRGHISGKELLDGIRELALQKFGPMAKNVLKYWGINKTEDFGNIVFNMIDKKLLQGNESDSQADFKEVYDFEDVFKNIVPDISLAE